MSILKWCILTGFNSLSLIDHHHLSVSLLLSYTLLFYTNQNVIMKEIFITLFYIWQVDNLLNDLISLESVDPNVDQDLNLLEPSLNHMSTTVSHNKEQPPPTHTPPPKKKAGCHSHLKKKTNTLFHFSSVFVFFIKRTAHQFLCFCLKAIVSLIPLQFSHPRRYILPGESKVSSL